GRAWRWASRSRPRIWRTAPRSRSGVTCQAGWAFPRRPPARPERRPRSMPSALRSDPVTTVLARLREAGRLEDEPAKQRVRAREAEAGRKIYGRERADLYGQAPIAVTHEVGELLYVLASGRRPSTVVEFGTSLGVSTIYLASAIRDAGAGVVITTEFQPEKAARASANL